MKTFLTMDEQPVILEWAAPRVGVTRWVADSEAIGLIEEGTGRIVAAAVLGSWTAESAELYVATQFDGDGKQTWAAMQLIGPVLTHAFVDRGLRRLVAKIDVANIKAQILALRVGFSVEGRERASFRGRDAAVFAMLRDECTWLDKGGADE